MAKQSINVGSSANDRSGDSLRLAFQKVNANFTELYTALGLNADTNLNIGAFEFSGSTMSTTDSSAITIDQATTISSNLTVGGDLLPSVANGGDLGSAAKPWHSLYVSNSTIYIGGNALGLDNEGELVWNGNRIAHAGGEYITLDSLTDVNANSPNAGDTIVWNGGAWVNGSLTQDRLADEGDEVVLVGGANPYVTFPAITGGDQLIIQGAEVSSVSGSLALTSQDNLNIIANGSGAAPGGSKSWTFSADGGLTIPGDIRSEQAINIDINLGDSTLRRWQFGEDGVLNLAGALQFADGTAQTTAFTTDPTLNVLKIDDGVHERFQAKTDATGTVQHNCALGHIFYHTSPDANWTANFTNLNLSSNYATAVTLVIVQGGTGYYPSAVQIGGVAQTLNWQGNTTPTPSTNRTDVVTFSIINNSGTYTVLGQLTGF